MASQITDVSFVCLNVSSGADQRKHQSSASLALVRGAHRWPVNSSYRSPVTRKMFRFVDAIMHFPLSFKIISRACLIQLHRCWSLVGHFIIYRFQLNQWWQGMRGFSNLYGNCECLPTDMHQQLTATVSYCVNMAQLKLAAASNTWIKRRQLKLLKISQFSVHYGDVIMGTIASQITSLTIVYSTVYSDADQRKYQSSASLAFVRGFHRGPVNSPHKWPVTRKMFPFADVIMRYKLWTWEVG